MAQRRGQPAAADVGFRVKMQPLAEHEGRSLVVAQQEARLTKELQVLVRKSGIKADGAFQQGNGFSRTPHGAENHRERVQAVTGIRAERQRLAARPDRRIALTAKQRRTGDGHIGKRVFRVNGDGPVCQRVRPRGHDISSVARPAVVKIEPFEI